MRLVLQKYIEEQKLKIIIFVAIYLTLFSGFMVTKSLICKFNFDCCIYAIHKTYVIPNNKQKHLNIYFYSNNYIERVSVSV